MAMAIPDLVDAVYAAQACPDATDFAVYAAADDGTGVLTGCAVSAQTSPNMTVQVASGWVQSQGKQVRVVAVASLTIPTASASDRRDLVVSDASGTVSVVTGRMAAGGNISVKSALPSGYVALAEVYVPGGTAVISSAMVLDRSITLFPGNVFISSTQPTVQTGQEYLWVQTGLGSSGTDMTLWVEDGT